MYFFLVGFYFVFSMVFVVSGSSPTFATDSNSNPGKWMIRIRRIRIHNTGPDNACYVTYELQLCVATLSDSPIRILDLVSELLLLLSTRFPLHQGRFEQVNTWKSRWVKK